MWCRCAWWSGSARASGTGSDRPRPWSRRLWSPWSSRAARSGCSWGARTRGQLVSTGPPRPGGSRARPSNPFFTRRRWKKAIARIPFYRTPPYLCPGAGTGHCGHRRIMITGFMDRFPLAYAIAHFRNVPAVRLMMAIGVPATVNMAKTLGITSPIFPDSAPPWALPMSP